MLALHRSALSAEKPISLRSATEPIDDTSTGKLMEGVLAAFAQFDNDVRSDRRVQGCAPRVPGFPTALDGELIDGSSHASIKVPLGKRPAGAGLQIALEADGSLLVGEFDDDVKLPGAPSGCVRAPAGVVMEQPRPHVRRETNVEVRLCIGTLENINESLVFRHDETEGNGDAESRNLKTRGIGTMDPATIAVSATRPRGEAVRIG
jgi:hypothetical protein